MCRREHDLLEKPLLKCQKRICSDRYERECHTEWLSERVKLRKFRYDVSRIHDV